MNRSKLKRKNYAKADKSDKGKEEKTKETEALSGYESDEVKSTFLQFPRA